MLEVRRGGEGDTAVECRQDAFFFEAGGGGTNLVESRGDGGVRDGRERFPSDTAR